MNNRISKVNQLLKKEIAQIVLRELNLQDVFVTITRVETSKDLRQTGVYISTMPEGQADRVLRILGREIYGIQQAINKRLNMRPIPKITFKKEGKTKEAARVEELLTKIDNKSGNGKIV